MFWSALLIALVSSEQIEWTSAGSGSWHNPSNWDRGRVPNLNDDVVLASLTNWPVLTIASSASARSIFSHETAAFTLAVSSTLQLYQVSHLGSQTNLRLSSGATLFLSDPSILTVNGSVHMYAGSMAGSGQFRNQGTMLLNLSNIGSEVVISCRFSNYGTVELQRGKLRLDAGGANAGPLIVYPGNSTLKVTATTPFLLTTTVSHIYLSGLLQIADTTTIEQLTMDGSNAALSKLGTGYGTYVILDLVTNGGNINSNVIVNTTKATFTPVTYFHINAGATLNLLGSTTWEAGPHTSGTFRDYQGVLNNYGNFSVKAPGWFVIQYYTTMVFRNYGTIKVTLPTLASSAIIQCNFFNYGTVEVHTGEIKFQYSLSLQSQSNLYLAANGTLTSTSSLSVPAHAKVGGCGIIKSPPGFSLLADGVLALGCLPEGSGDLRFQGGSVTSNAQSRILVYFNEDNVTNGKLAVDTASTLRGRLALVLVGLPPNTFNASAKLRVASYPSTSTVTFTYEDSDAANLQIDISPIATNLTVTPCSFYDVCYVCEGNGTSCLSGCDNKPFSMLKFDLCGICDGNNRGCCSNHGQYNGTHCICDGSYCGQNCSKVLDSCSVCGGNCGSSCSDAVNCRAGLLCVDGVCCTSSCDGLCETCALAGFLGQCKPQYLNTDPDDDCATCAACNGARACQNVSAGTDPINDCLVSAVLTCGLDGFCDGIGHCRLYSTSVLCQSHSCANGVEQLGKNCDGSGACSVYNGNSSCSPYVCAGSSTCYYSCWSVGHSACEATHYCSGTACVPKLPSGSPCSDSVVCLSGACLCNGTCGAIGTGGCIAAGVKSGNIFVSMLKFGNNLVGSGIQNMSLELHNLGTLPLELGANATQLLGADANSFSASRLPSSLSIGSSTPFWVSFVPTTPGSKVALLRIGSVFNLTLHASTELPADSTSKLDCQLPLLLDYPMSCSLHLRNNNVSIVGSGPQFNSFTVDSTAKRLNISTRFTDISLSDWASPLDDAKLIFVFKEGLGVPLWSFGPVTTRAGSVIASFAVATALSVAQAQAAVIDLLSLGHGAFQSPVITPSFIQATLANQVWALDGSSVSFSLTFPRAAGFLPFQNIALLVSVNGQSLVEQPASIQLMLTPTIAPPAPLPPGSNSSNFLAINPFASSLVPLTLPATDEVRCVMMPNSDVGVTDAATLFTLISGQTTLALANTEVLVPVVVPSALTSADYSVVCVSSSGLSAVFGVALLPSQSLSEGEQALVAAKSLGGFVVVLFLVLVVFQVAGALTAAASSTSNSASSSNAKQQIPSEWLLLQTAFFLQCVGMLGTISESSTFREFTGTFAFINFILPAPFLSKSSSGSRRLLLADLDAVAEALDVDELQLIFVQLFYDLLFFLGLQALLWLAVFVHEQVWERDGPLPHSVQKNKAETKGAEKVEVDVGSVQGQAKVGDVVKDSNVEINTMTDDTAGQQAASVKQAAGNDGDAPNDEMNPDGVEGELLEAKGVASNVRESSGSPLPQEDGPIREDDYELSLTVAGMLRAAPLKAAVTILLMIYFPLTSYITIFLANYAQLAGAGSTTIVVIVWIVLAVGVCSLVTLARRIDKLEGEARLKRDFVLGDVLDGTKTEKHYFAAIFTIHRIVCAVLTGLGSLAGVDTQALIALTLLQLAYAIINYRVRPHELQIQTAVRSGEEALAAFVVLLTIISIYKSAEAIGILQSIVTVLALLLAIVNEVGPMLQEWWANRQGQSQKLG